MKIKESKNINNIYCKLNDFCAKPYRIKLILPVGIILIFIAANLASISYGMYLKKSGQSMTLKRWALSLAHHKLSFIPNFFNGFLGNPEHINIDIKFEHY